jgi:hypothetical protein
MESFEEFRPMVADPRYQDRRRHGLIELNATEIYAPIADLIEDLCRFHFCYPVQSCFGHFLYPGQEDPKNLEPLPATGEFQSIEYRIAYVALCVENSWCGREFLRWLKQIPEIDPNYIQFGCAEWLWDRNQNSYVLQVDPERFMLKNKCSVDFLEALHIEKVRDEFFNRLRFLVSKINMP